MRVLLFTGKGGVGTTTWSAATAAHAASSGRKTLLLGIDSGSLSDVCGVQLGAQPIEIAGNLYAAGIDSQLALERSWPDIGDAVSVMLGGLGAAALDQAELAVLPGAHELLTLLELHAQFTSGRWEAIVFDAGPDLAALRLLTLPGTLTWYAERLFSLPRKGSAASHPIGPDVEPRPQAVFNQSLARLHNALRALRDALTDPSVASVRLVTAAQAMAAGAAGRSLQSFSLHGIRVDGVIANSVADTDYAAAQLARIEETFSNQWVLRSPMRSEEPVGIDALRQIAADSYAERDPLSSEPGASMLQVNRAAASFILSLAVPLAECGDVSLVRRGDEMVVTVHGHRRLLTLPSALRRCLVTAAELRGGRLQITFDPDPDLWLRS